MRLYLLRKILQQNISLKNAEVILIKTSEKYIQTKFIKFLNDNRIYNFKTIICSKSGIPDCVACINGAFVAFEFKGSDGKLSALQVYNKSKIEVCGGKFYEVNPSNITQIMEEVTECMTQYHG